jgi:hypothetical protein
MDKEYQIVCQFFKLNNMVPCKYFQRIRGWLGSGCAPCLYALATARCSLNDEIQFLYECPISQFL